MVKYGIIRDAGLFSFLEENYADVLKQGDGLLHVVKMSCGIKARVVEEDEREAGIRSILNFGHTFGHAVETVTDYKELRHGEAVAIGMAAAARISFKLGLCSKDVCERIERLVSKIGLPIKLSAVSRQLSAKELLQAMEMDKKAAGGNIKFVMVEDIGKVIFKQMGISDFSIDLSEILN